MNADLGRRAVVVVGDAPWVERDGYTITAPGTWSGRFVLVDVAQATVIGDVPVHAHTNDYVSSSGPFVNALRNNLESNIREETMKVCPLKLLPPLRP